MLSATVGISAVELFSERPQSLYTGHWEANEINVMLSFLLRKNGVTIWCLFVNNPNFWSGCVFGHGQVFVGTIIVMHVHPVDAEVFER